MHQLRKARGLVSNVSSKSCGRNCVLVHTDPVHRGANSSPKLVNQGSSDPWVFPRLKIASFRARSKHSWSLSSRHSFGLSPTGFGPGGARTAPWSTSDDRTRIVTGKDKGHVGEGWIRVPRIPRHHALG